jgi:two-component system chemotaxis response regulator CheY
VREALKKILVADDAEFFRVRVSNLLAGENFEILQASCGTQAVSIFKNEHPDLVLLDLSISNMEGLASLKKIKDIDPEAKVVMLSMLGEENAVFEAIQLGARNYLRKPVDRNHFSYILEKQFAQV